MDVSKISYVAEYRIHLTDYFAKISGEKRNPGTASKSSRQGLALISSFNQLLFQVKRKHQTMDCGFYVMQDLGEETLNKSFSSSYL